MGGGLCPPQLLSTSEIIDTAFATVDRGGLPQLWRVGATLLCPLIQARFTVPCPGAGGVCVLGDRQVAVPPHRT